MKDIDRVNIQGGLVFEHDFDKVEKSGFEKPSFRGVLMVKSPFSLVLYVMLLT